MKFHRAFSPSRAWRGMPTKVLFLGLQRPPTRAYHRPSTTSLASAKWDELAQSLSSLGSASGAEATARIDELIRQLQSAKSDIQQTGSAKKLIAESESRLVESPPAVRSAAGARTSGDGSGEATASVSATAITPQSEDFSAWYNDILQAAEMIDGSAVRGCPVIRPWGMAIWDAIRARLDATDWVDGRATVGPQGAQVKQNRQLPELSPVG
eukprot:gene44563-54499_t